MLLDDYQDCMAVGMTLVSAGEECREFFHRISVFSSKYSLEDTDRKLDDFLQNTRSIKIGSFFYKCHEYGVIPDSVPHYESVGFSVEVLPKVVQRIVFDTHSFQNFPIDYIAPSLLFVACAACGNSTMIQISNTPYGSQIIPTLNINNPVQVTAENIYLRPSFSHNSYLSFRHNNPSKYSFLNLSLDGSAYTNEIVYASWFDADGNRYAIPVNSQKPSLSTRLYCSFEMPLDQKKHFTFSLYTNVQYSLSTSYQARTLLPGLDKDNFNYENMMPWFWGDEGGNLFYSGTSGFAQSKTNTLSYRILPSLEYKLDNFSTQLSAGAWNRITKYSLNPTANMNS